MGILPTAEYRKNQILMHSSFKSSKCSSPLTILAPLARAVARTHESTSPHLLILRLRSALILPAVSAISSSRETIAVLVLMNLSLSSGSAFSRTYLSVNSATTTVGVIASPLSMNGFAFSPRLLPPKYSIQAKVSITTSVVNHRSPWNLSCSRLVRLMRLCLSAPNILDGTASALSISEFIVWSKLLVCLVFMSLLSFSTVVSFTAIVVVMYLTYIL